jgi:hypothetical protein
MISASHVREWLAETPFQPFRIYLSDGSYHDVPHPEFAWIFGSRIFLGMVSGSNSHVEDQVKQLSLLHVSRIEPLPAKRQPRKRKVSRK